MKNIVKAADPLSSSSPAPLPATNLPQSREKTLLAVYLSLMFVRLQLEDGMRLV
ncbi:hypothetical protein [Paenibacillus eucommiae]|uniref:Uncharacterized protein n=1 Tax=Paenibacillus eucommiae TaxID=1355755 RepID=A0ABS4J3Q8_9BACL|nr:hypothetical protein [Paenibacillus eucommiae]MBP1994476.1 hypothetical protein [Paenibacillus eucommiae]